MVLDKATMDAMMEPLRNRYLTLLNEWLIEIYALRDHIENGSCTGEQLNSLAVKAHNLAGTGTTYGYEAISEAGKALEENLLTDKGKNTKQTVRLFDALVDACMRAVQKKSDVIADANITAQPHADNKQRPVILSVDDDPAVRDIITHLFKDEAHVVTAFDSTEALILMIRHNPHLVILDDNMPGGLSGLKFLEITRKNPKLAHIPVMMLSANKDQHKITTGLNLGAIEYITKPFKPQELADKVRAHLKQLSAKE